MHARPKSKITSRPTGRPPLGGRWVRGSTRHEADVLRFDVAVEDAVVRQGERVAILERRSKLASAVDGTFQRPVALLLPRYPKGHRIGIIRQLLPQSTLEALKHDKGHRIVLVAKRYGAEDVRVSEHRHEHDLALEAAYWQ